MWLSCQKFEPLLVLMGSWSDRLIEAPIATWGREISTHFFIGEGVHVENSLQMVGWSTKLQMKWPLTPGLSAAFCNSHGFGRHITPALLETRTPGNQRQCKSKSTHRFTTSWLPQQQWKVQSRSVLALLAACFSDRAWSCVRNDYSNLSVNSGNAVWIHCIHNIIIREEKKRSWTYLKCFSQDVNELFRMPPVITCHEC